MEKKFRVFNWDEERFVGVDSGRFVSSRQALVFYLDKPFELGGMLELQQWTGLKDRNGKEVYEGDILSFPDTESEHVDVGVGMRSVEARFRKMSKKHHDVSSFVVFGRAVRSQHFKRPMIAKYFRRLVDKNDYDRKDIMRLTEHFLILSEDAEI